MSGMKEEGVGGEVTRQHGALQAGQVSAQRRGFKPETYRSALIGGVAKGVRL